VWEGDVGGIGYHRHGHPLPPETLEIAKAADAGAVRRGRRSLVR
jgi:3-isopropylmalate dehydrogenase